MYKVIKILGENYARFIKIRQNTNIQLTFPTHNCPMLSSDNLNTQIDGWTNGQIWLIWYM